MPLIKCFHETVRERLKTDPGFKEALLLETLEEALHGDRNVAESMFHKYFKNNSKVPSKDQ